MWDWLPWGSAAKPRPKHLSDLLDRLLGAGPQLNGDEAFELPEKELKRLCSAARELLLKEPALLEINADSNVVVVGDLHGQFHDLQRMFKRLGRPGSDGKVWLFLGDYIDRGPMGLEIVATLLALKLRHPASIHLLRGNHECSEITVLFGFCSECQRRSTLAAWEAVMQVFDALPLAALLNNQVFLCHGGISPYLHRPHDVNTIRRPLDVNPNGEGLLADLLWADPSPHVSGWVPNPRGVSFIFGLDVARKWLHAQGLRALVRAHMVQQAGFEVLGNNEVMTVFSATDYRETGNTGAVLVIAPSLAFEFVCFPPQRPAPAPGEAAAEVVEDAAPCGPDATVLQGVSSQFSSPPPMSPFAAQAAAAAAAAAVVAAAAAAPEAAPGPSPAAQAMQQEVEEEQLVMQQVSGDEDLAKLVHARSAGLQQLETLTGGSRVPAEALARASPRNSPRAGAAPAGTPFNS